MPRRKSVKPWFEVLEDRLAPAVRMVTSIGDSGANGFPGQLRTEIARAAANDEIRIDLSRYGYGRTIPLRQGPILVDKNLTIVGTQGVSILGGLGGATNRALDFERADGAVSATISGITFTGCQPANGNGGAIFVRGNLTLNSCTFEDNSAALGGAVDVVPPPNPLCTVAITGCTFKNNSAGSGGALNIEPNDSSTQRAQAATVTVNTSVFQNNRATGSAGLGGAIEDLGTYHTLIVTDSSFDGNSAQNGGAINSKAIVFRVESTTGNRSVFNDNRARGNAASSGGAIAYSPVVETGQQPGAFSLTGVQFSLNGATSRGGAVDLFKPLSTLISGCLFVNNSAGGGGALNVENPQVTFGIVNSTFVKNQAASRGGAINIIGNNLQSGSVSFTSLTITQNEVNGQGGQGGGLRLPTDNQNWTPKIGNCIIAGNKAGTGNDVYSNVDSQGFNLIGISDGSAGWNVGGSKPDQLGTLNAPKDPGLRNLDDNGGPTYTLAVPNTSLAYRRGNPTLQDVPPPFNLDQRGRVRNGTVGGVKVVSVGAFEPDSAGGSAPNHSPIGGNNTVSTPQNTPYRFALADFNFTDPNDNPPNNFRGVLITSLPARGYLVINGSRQTLVGQDIFVSAANIAAGGLQFYPTGGNASPYASFTFRVQDDGGTANGGSDTDTMDRTMTINVTRVNAAPVGANNTVTTLKNTGYTFAAGDFGFTDPNDSPPDSLNAVEITTSPGAGTLTDNGVAVSATNFVSVSDINAGLLVFNPAVNAIGDPYTTFTFQVQDDGGTANGGVDLDPSPKNMTINVMNSTWVNHAPIGTSNTVTTLENIGYAFTTSDFGFTDPNDSPANNFLAVKISTLPTAGTLSDNGVALSAGSFVNVSQINAGLLVFTPATNASGTGYASFSFQVKDDGGTNNGGVDTDPTPKTLTVNVTMNNQAPSGANNTVTTLENAPYTFSAADFGFTDPNDSPPNNFSAVEITDLPMFGTLKDNGVAVTAGAFVSINDINSGKLVFTPETDINGSPYDLFFFQVQDDGGTANGGVNLDSTPKSMTINVTWVNQGPSGTNNTINVTENTPYTFAAGDFGFSDPNDSPGSWFQAVKITTLPSVGTISDNGVAVTPGTFISVTDIFAGLLVYNPPANSTGVPYASFTDQVQNDGGTANGGVDTDPTPKTITINVKMGTSTTLSSSLNPSYKTQLVTFTAMVTPVAPATGTATGTVNFYDVTNLQILLGPGTLTNGVATFATSALSDGVHTITAVYTGDTSFAGSTSANLTQTVLINNTNTSVTSSLNPANQNQAVTFTANVIPSSTPVNAPRTGTVDFYDGLNPTVKIGSGTVANGVATFTTSSLGAGDHIITAWYEGDGTYNGSTSQGLTQTVNSGGSAAIHPPTTKASTRTGLTSSRRSAPLGTPVTFTASIVAASASSHTPTGTVQFWEVDPVTGANIRLLSTTSLDATGHASLTISSLTRGVHRIKAVYLGDTNFVGSFSLYDETIT